MLPSTAKSVNQHKTSQKRMKTLSTFEEWKTLFIPVKVLMKSKLPKSIEKVVNLAMMNLKHVYVSLFFMFCCVLLLLFLGW
jgi:hypothetical protein